MAIVGFDFGTTNSLISYIRGGRAIHCLDDQQRPIPSVVCYEGSSKIVGREAKERLAQAGLGIQGNIVRSPKMFLGHDPVHVEGVPRHPVDVVADVVGHVCRQARSHRAGPDEITGAVVTIPVDMQGYRRRALRAACLAAGLRIVQFVHEPLAALYGLLRQGDMEDMARRYNNKLMLVFDWGGGTLDLTLCRLSGNILIQLMNDGTDEVGGDIFDEALMNNLLLQVARNRGLDDGVEIQPGARARLLDRCERAKVDLSVRDEVTLFVRDFYRGIDETDFDFTLDQAALEAVVKPLLDKGFRRIERILDNAGFAPEQVALCVATGGMSNMPAVRRRLHEWFGPQRVRIPDGTATLIAEGAAWIAADKQRLRLAKNVELLLARNSYLPLVKAGTAMPGEHEEQQETFNLFCTDPRDGFAKFQVGAPRRAGPGVLPGEPRTVLDLLTIKVDSQAKAFQERLVLDVAIDHDLVMKLDARSLNKKDHAQCEIHNLEFGLPLTVAENSSGPDSDGSLSANANSEPSETGALTIRANVAAKEDLSLVPGEFLYEYNPHYFDQRNRPPREQDAERLYYVPCCICGRDSNDPLCTCSQ